MKAILLTVAAACLAVPGHAANIQVAGDETSGIFTKIISDIPAVASDAGVYSADIVDPIFYDAQARRQSSTRRNQQGSYLEQPNRYQTDNRFTAGSQNKISGQRWEHTQAGVKYDNFGRPIQTFANKVNNPSSIYRNRVTAAQGGSIAVSQFGQQPAGFSQGNRLSVRPTSTFDSHRQNTGFGSIVGQPTGISPGNQQFGISRPIIRQDLQNQFGSQQTASQFSGQQPAGQFAISPTANQFGQQFGRPSTSQFGQSGIGQFGQQQATQFGQQGTTQFGQPAISQFGQQPVSQFGQQPVSQFGQQIPSQFGQQPGTPFGQQPGIPFGQQASSQFGQQTSTQFGQQAINQFGQQSGSQFGQQSGSQFQQQPIQFGQQPSTQFGQQPSTQFGKKPLTQFGKQPSTQFGQQVTSQFGQQPSSQFGQQPSSQFGQQTGGQFGQQIGSQFGQSAISPAGQRFTGQQSGFQPGIRTVGNQFDRIPNQQLNSIIGDPFRGNEIDSQRTTGLLG